MVGCTDSVKHWRYKCRSRRRCSRCTWPIETPPRHPENTAQWYWSSWLAPFPNPQVRSKFLQKGLASCACWSVLCYLLGSPSRQCDANLELMLRPSTGWIWFMAAFTITIKISSNWNKYTLGSYPITFSLEPLGGFVFCKTGLRVL